MNMNCYVFDYLGKLLWGACPNMHQLLYAERVRCQSKMLGNMTIEAYALYHILQYEIGGAQSCSIILPHCCFQRIGVEVERHVKARVGVSPRAHSVVLPLPWRLYRLVLARLGTGGNPRAGGCSSRLDRPGNGSGSGRRPRGERRPERLFGPGGMGRLGG
jgi:hypothetical protein